MSYINKVKSHGEIFDVHDSRIEEIPENVKIEGTSLVIPEQPAPEPVIEIDGVKYYHKQEFDLENLVTVLDRYFDILTGEEISEQYLNQISLLSIPDDGQAVNLNLKDNDENYCLFSEPGFYEVDYTSKAFTVVNTLAEVTDNTKICLPECVAYYGFLSEDGKTFISYFNLKSDGAPEKIDGVKQGDKTIPLKDNRVPTTSSTDEGKVLGVDASGNIVAQTPAVGGTQLYKHKVDFSFTHNSTQIAGYLLFTSTYEELPKPMCDIFASSTPPNYGDPIVDATGLIYVAERDDIFKGWAAAAHLSIDEDYNPQRYSHFELWMVYDAMSESVATNNVEYTHLTDLDFNDTVTPL